MADEPRPDISFSHDIGPDAGKLGVECYGGNTPDEAWIVMFGTQCVTLTAIDFDNYIADLVRSRDQVRKVK